MKHRYNDLFYDAFVDDAARIVAVYNANSGLTAEMREVIDELCDTILGMEVRHPDEQS